MFPTHMVQVTQPHQGGTNSFLPTPPFHTRNCLIAVVLAYTFVESRRLHTPVFRQLCYMERRDGKKEFTNGLGFTTHVLLVSNNHGDV